jgi:hypothetical protein
LFFFFFTSLQRHELGFDFLDGGGGLDFLDGRRFDDANLAVIRVTTTGSRPLPLAFGRVHGHALDGVLVVHPVYPLPFADEVVVVDVDF